MKADHKKVVRKLKTAKGQLEGMLKMIEDDRYCIDISNQILATQALLASANKDILIAHLENCVMQALEEGEAHGKMEEIAKIIGKLSK